MNGWMLKRLVQQQTSGGSVIGSSIYDLYSSAAAA